MNADKIVDTMCGAKPGAFEYFINKNVKDNLKKYYNVDLTDHLMYTRDEWEYKYLKKNSLYNCFKGTKWYDSLSGDIEDISRANAITIKLVTVDETIYYHKGRRVHSAIPNIEINRLFNHYFISVECDYSVIEHIISGELCLSSFKPKTTSKEKTNLRAIILLLKGHLLLEPRTDEMAIKETNMYDSTKLTPNVECVLQTTRRCPKAITTVFWIEREGLIHYVVDNKDLDELESEDFLEAETFIDFLTDIVHDSNIVCYSYCHSVPTIMIHLRVPTIIHRSNVEGEFKNTRIKFYDVMDLIPFLLIDYATVFKCPPFHVIRTLITGYKTFAQWIKEDFNINIDRINSIASLANVLFHTEECFNGVYKLKGLTCGFVQNHIRDDRMLYSREYSGETSEIDLDKLYIEALTTFKGFPKGVCKIIPSSWTLDDLEKVTAYVCKFKVIDAGNKQIYSKGFTLGEIVFGNKIDVQTWKLFLGMTVQLIEGYYWDNGYTTKIVKAVEKLSSKINEDNRYMYTVLLNQLSIVKKAEHVDVEYKWLSRIQFEHLTVSRKYKILKVELMGGSGTDGKGFYRITQKKSIFDHTNYGHCKGLIISHIRHTLYYILDLVKDHVVRIYEDSIRMDKEGYEILTKHSMNEIL